MELIAAFGAEHGVVFRSGFGERMSRVNFPSRLNATHFCELTAPARSAARVYPLGNSITTTSFRMRSEASRR